MVRTSGAAERYRTTVSNGRLELTADTVKDGVGGAAGFRPHALLEAALASCMNISVRLRADELGLGPVAVATAVELDRSRPGMAAYRCRVRLEGAFTAAQRADLLAAARGCAVGQTLRRQPVFEVTGEEVAA